MYKPACLIDIVKETCEKFPYKIALVQEDNGKSIDYKSLLSLVGDLTAPLQNIISTLSPSGCRIASETPLISIMTQRSIGTVIALLSILNAGAAYVPVDPTFPTDRQVHIFTHSKSLLLIVDEKTYEQVKSTFVDVTIPPILVIDSLSGKIISNLTSINISHTVTPVYFPDPYNLAYILYTSGSTGMSNLATSFPPIHT